MSDTSEKLAKLKEKSLAQLKECGVTNVNDEQLDGYVKSLRTMLGNRDALLVSGTDKAELETVYRNFVVKKCNVDDKDKGMKAITAVAEKMSGIKQKSRPAFYYMVAHELK